MKEYKVIKPQLGWRNTTDKLEELLNKYAKEGWRVNTITPNQHLISFIVLDKTLNSLTKNSTKIMIVLLISMILTIIIMTLNLL